MKYRSRNEIIEKILQEAQEPMTLTKIMYKSYLSYRQVKEYISYLVKYDLLELNDKTSEYKTTSKGMQFLKNSQNIQNLLE